MKYIIQIRSIIQRGIDTLTFKSSKNFWIKRYKNGGNSGAGSYGELAQFKANVINGFVHEHAISAVIEYGCGDGNQLTLADYPQYIGFDISLDAVALCKKLFSTDFTKTFYLMAEYNHQKADLTLSLDVIYHLVEDDVFERYMRLLFESSKRYVIIYSSNFNSHIFTSPHVRHRKFTDWVEKEISGWLLTEHIPNPHTTSDSKERSTADFFIYQKANGGD